MGASIADVARLSGVSVATVSRALRGLPNVSPATRDRVRAAADELRYVADPNAARLAGRSTRTVGLVVPVLSSWYHAQVVAGVEGALVAEGYDLLPFVVGGAQRLQRFVEELPFRKRVDGLLLVDVPMTQAQVATVTGAGVPVVTSGVRVDGIPSLRLDDHAAAAAAVAHLLEQGHQRVAVIGGLADDPFGFQVPRDRLAGARDALGAAGLSLDDDLVVSGNFSFAGGAEAMHDLLALPDPPTAVFAISDEMAVGAIHAARSCGLVVPDDLAVVGFDDHDVARYVDLTTVRQDVLWVGERLTELLLEQLGDDDVLARHETVPAELVVRGTSVAGTRATATAGATPATTTSTTTTTTAEHPAADHV